MSSSMRNFMEAYSAVHSTEAREELLSKRDEIAEMDLSMISDPELEDICEEVLKELFDLLIYFLHFPNSYLFDHNL